MKVIFSADNILIDSCNELNYNQEGLSCSIYGMDPDGNCAVDMSDGCSCDTYSNAG